MRTRSIVCKCLVYAMLLSVVTTAALAQAVWKQYQGPFAGEIASIVNYGDTLFASSNNSGLFKSTDGGKKWSVTLETEVPHAYSLFATDTSLLIGTDKLVSYVRPGKPLVQIGQNLPGVIGYMLDFKGKLFITTDMGFFKYDPAANEFIEKNNDLPVFEFGTRWTRHLAAIDGTLFCSVLASGIYKSDDEGEHWERLNIGNRSYGFQFMILHDGVLYCGGGNALFSSADKGETWTDMKDNLSDGTFYNMEAVGNTLFTTTFTGTYRRTGGYGWEKIDDAVYGEMMYNGDVFFVCNSNGVYRWDADSETFVLSNTGVNTSRVNGIELFDKKVYSATESGVHFTSTDGDDWSIVPELTNLYSKTIAQKGNKLFVGTSTGLYVTTAGSMKWEKAENGLPTDVPLWDIEVSGDKIYLGTDDGVYVSYNDGGHWKALPYSFPLHPQVIYISANDSMLVAGNNFGLYKILPDSSDWEKVEDFTGKETFSLNIIAGNVYASTMNSPIYRSTDYCKTWSLVNIPAISKIEMIKRGDNIYAVDYGNIFSSSDDGNTWDYIFETGVPDVLLTDIAEGDSAFYLGTYGKSIWRRPFLSTTDIRSLVYEIGDSVIYHLDPGTSLGDFKSNVTLAYGTSVEVVTTGPHSGRVKEAGNIQENDKIKIMAEDGKNMRTLRVAKKDVVTAVEASAKDKITVYPVPTKGVLFVSNSHRIKSCSIVNSMGEKVQVPNLRDNYIDVTSLARGIYFFSAQDIDNKKHVLKFVKE